MSEKIKVRVSGRIQVCYQGTIEMDRAMYEKLHAEWEEQKSGIDEDILCDFAYVMRNGYTDDAECDEFEEVK